MWDTSNIVRVSGSRTDSDTRVIVLGADGRTDVLATLYVFGSDRDRLAAARALLKSARALIEQGREYRGDSYDVTNGLRAEGAELIEKALWMAPNGFTITYRGQEWKVDGWGGNSLLAVKGGRVEELSNVDVEAINF